MFIAQRKRRGFVTNSSSQGGTIYIGVEKGITPEQVIQRLGLTSIESRRLCPEAETNFGVDQYSLDIHLLALKYNVYSLYFVWENDEISFEYGGEQYLEEYYETIKQIMRYPGRDIFIIRTEDDL